MELDDLEGTLPRLHAGAGFHSPAELSVPGGQDRPSIVADDAWSQYLGVDARAAGKGTWGRCSRSCGRGKASSASRPADAADNDPRKIVARTITYLENNRLRMNYPGYRKAGLPVTTAWMESLVKEVNYRVKGTEMFWNNPEGAEAILQVRAAALSDDDRLSKYLHTRARLPLHPPPQIPQTPRRNLQKLKCTHYTPAFVLCLV